MKSYILAILAIILAMGIIFGGCSIVETTPQVTTSVEQTAKEAIEQHTIKGKVNSSSSISISFNYIGGQTPASIYLAPNLAVKYGLIRL